MVPLWVWVIIQILWELWGFMWLLINLFGSLWPIVRCLHYVTIVFGVACVEVEWTYFVIKLTFISDLDPFTRSVG